MSYFRTFQGSLEPEFTVKPQRHFANLFEAPTLFYAGCLAAMVAGVTGPVVVALAWGYVAMRYLHAYIHLGGNRVRYRMRAYFASWLCLLALWGYVGGGRGHACRGARYDRVKLEHRCEAGEHAVGASRSMAACSRWPSALA